MTPGAKRRIVLWIFITGFITNLIWENAQMPLYSGYEGFGQHFLLCLVASIIDGVSILALYLMISVVRKNSLWLFNIRALDIILLFILGLLVSTLLERWGLKSGAWKYTSQMPLVLGMGLAPLLQLAVLSIISVFIVRLALPRKVVNRKYNSAGSEG